ncbi:Arc family DNA-binding protein [Pseudomonas protegens]|uniref:Arc family DNA-binding protein n=1 Tax=Pseudomonas protegens TaxID=380021 RepID=UPI001C69E977|nr:Arc family DNA-binding protein [Pseudomonas protegens]QYM99543.1 Arc family DNA-binding protein [Pseudomonas protegens]
MNKQYDSRTADKFVVRLPEGLRAQVEQSAGTSDTSMNTVFIQALRQYLDNQGRQQVLLDALAAAYVRAGEKEHELRFQLHDREGSRRDWFEAAQAAEKRVEEMREELEGLKEVGRLQAEALKGLIFAARTTGGTAGPDLGLMQACEKAEHAISLGGIGRAYMKGADAALSASAEPSEREAHALQAEKALGIERLPATPRDERAEFEQAFVVQEGVFFSKERNEYRSMNGRPVERTDATDLNLRLQGWQARAALNKATEGASHA